MIDEWSPDRTGFARFSHDRRFRYRLARAITPLALESHRERFERGDTALAPIRVVFVMLNPSTADAFKLDPTVSKCVQFAQRWGADTLEVVNLFAMRSPYPEDLRWAHTAENAGGDTTNDAEILAACTGAHRVIAAWGRHGEIYNRAYHVERMLRTSHVKVDVLGWTQDGAPVHPLARGKSWVPLTREPQPWP